MNKIKINFNEEENEILTKRTDNLSQATKLVEQKSNDKITYLTFNVNNIRYAVEQSYIQELHSEISPKKIPCVPKFIKGIVNIRGDILSITDLSLFFGNKAIAERDNYQMFRLKNKNIEFGVIVDNIEDTLLLSKADIYAFSNSENPKMDQYIKGVDKDMVNILNIDSIMNDDLMIINNNNS
ncbi:MAG: chemotaxis protein CheW [Candidatus Sericytochromatia bacterium]|nr:chemotaxis protein CheW [Candidatus Sericytochromatia bacterium]